MNRQILSPASQEGELGDHFLGELVWAVYIVAPGDDDRQFIGGVVSFGHHFSSSFGS